MCHTRVDWVRLVQPSRTCTKYKHCVKKTDMPWISRQSRPNNGPDPEMELDGQ